MTKKVVLFAFVLLLAIGKFVFAADLISLAPESAEFVVGINISKALAHEELLAKVNDAIYMQNPEQKKVLEELLAKNDLGIAKSLEKVLFLVMDADTRGGNPEGVIVFKGKFPTAKLKTTIKNGRDLAIFTFEGYDTIKVKDEWQLLFLDDAIAIGGSQKNIKAVIDAKRGKTSALMAKSAFVNLFKRVNTDAMFWGIGRVSGSFSKQCQESSVSASLSTISRISFSFDSSDYMRFNFIAETEKKENVAGLVGAIANMVALVRTVLGSSPDAIDIGNLINIEAGDDSAKLSVCLPKSQYEALKKKIGGLLPHSQP